MTLSTSCIFLQCHLLPLDNSRLSDCIYNESIYSILNLKDVDSTLIQYQCGSVVVYLNGL